MSLRRRKLTIFGALALVVIASSLSFAENEPPSTRNRSRSQTSRPRFVSRVDVERANDRLPSIDDRFQGSPKAAKGRNASFRLVSAESEDYFGELQPGHSEPAETPFLPDPEQPLFGVEEQGVSITPEMSPLMEQGCDCCEPLFERILSPNRNCRDCCQGVENWSPLVRHLGFPGKCCGEPGIGHERVVFAPFIIDPTQPQNYTMMRWDSGFGLHTPDRSEFFWSKPGKGPAISPDQINFQDMIYVNETGNSAFSVMTEIPVRFIESDYGSTSGMGDMRVATKARLINGKNWQITQIFRTSINTGSTTKGVGAGHVSLEPGILARYEIRPDTFVHGEVKFLVPISASTGFASNILTYGVGVSHVLYETDHFAIIPNLEMVNYDFLSGQKTVGNTAILPGQVVNANNDLAINVIPGARFVFGPKGDLGLFEFGISSMIGLGDRYVNDMLRLEFKFTH